MGFFHSHDRTATQAGRHPHTHTSGKPTTMGAKTAASRARLKRHRAQRDEQPADPVFLRLVRQLRIKQREGIARASAEERHAWDKLAFYLLTLEEQLEG